MSDTVIRVENLSKMYDLGLVGTGTLSKDLNRAWARMRGKPDPYAKLAELNDRTVGSKSDTVWALKDINFEVKQGEVLGIIGKNGAGKSTLLKILSQITAPTEGSVKIKGRVASLLEVGTGMHPEMTARQNIYLNGSIMGMRRREITSKLDEIIDFAGIAKYVDTPIKRFSSGMQVRLGFAVAAFLEPEILIVDEVLAVGDAEFQKKAIGKMQDVSQSQGRTVLFVSHNLSSIRHLCEKGILLHAGQVMYHGSATLAIEKYTQDINSYMPIVDLSDYSSRTRGEKNIFLKEVKLNSAVFLPDSLFSMTIQLSSQPDYTANKIKIQLFFFDSLQNIIFHISSDFHDEVYHDDLRSDYTFVIDRLSLNTGIYSIGVWLGDNGLEQDYVSDRVYFTVETGNIYSNRSLAIKSIVQSDFRFYGNLSFSHKKN